MSWRSAPIQLGGEGSPARGSVKTDSWDCLWCESFSSTLSEHSRNAVWAVNLSSLLGCEAWTLPGSANWPTRHHPQQTAAHRRSCDYWYVLIPLVSVANSRRTRHVLRKQGRVCGDCAMLSSWARCCSRKQEEVRDARSIEP